MRLCHHKGFDLTRCGALFVILARYEDDVRALEDALPFDWLEPSTPFRAWVRERVSGYPTLAGRREALEAHRILLERGAVE